MYMHINLVHSWWNQFHFKLWNLKFNLFQNHNIGTVILCEIPGGARKSLHFYENCCHFCCIITTKPCNTRMERKFCWFFGNISKNFEKFSYEAVFAFFWQVAEMTNIPILLCIGKFEMKKYNYYKYLNWNKHIIEV